MAKNLGIVGADNVLYGPGETKKSSGITRPKKGMQYYDNGKIIGKKKKKKDEEDIRTIKNTTHNQNQVKNTMNNVPNNDGYIKTNQKYGDYDYHDYKKKKDYDIYKKDNKSYYYDPNSKTYVDMDMPRMTTKKQDKKELKEAKKYGYTGKKIYKDKDKKEQVLPTKVAEQVELETSGLTKKEKEKYSKSLIRQEKKSGKDSTYVREGNTIGELKNITKNVDEKAIEPLARAPQSYDYGKLSQELSLAYYDKLRGKKNNIEEIQRKIDNYNKFNQDIVNSNNMLDTHFKNLPNEIGGIKAGIKNAGPLGAIGAVGGGAIGAVATRTPAGALAGAEQGAKWLGGSGYVKGQAENTYKLEAGATYQALLEMGVPDEIAKKEAKRVGTENALIESGESILDLITLGRAGIATNALKEGLIKKYGAEALKKWGVSYATNIASEGLQEGAQEQRSIAAEKRAAKKAGIKRDNSQDTQRILGSIKAGSFSAGLTGAGTRIAGMTGSNIYNMTKQKATQMLEIQQQVNNGTMTHEEANQKIEQVNNGTYDKNKVLDEIATQKRDEVEQAAQQGIISPAQATQEIQALNNTLVEEREQISRDSKIEAMQETIQQMDVNGYISKNYTNEQLQDFMDQVYDDNLSNEELQQKLYETIFKDSAKKQATNVLDISAKDTKMTKDEFIKRHYNKQLEQDFGVSKEEAGKIYDKYHKEETSKSNYEQLRKDSEREVVKMISQKSGKKGRSYQGKFYSDEGFSKLDDNDIKLSTKLMKKLENQQKLTKNEEQQAEYLRRKKEGLKNPEINPNIKSYEDIKSDYKYVREHELTKSDNKKIQASLDIVSANKQGRRTKQQWLDVANNIGMQSENLDSEALKNLAFGSWAELSPNQKDVLNRQGSKYVSFDAHEWVREVYKGAKVGTKIKEETNQATQPKQEKPKNEGKTKTNDKIDKRLEKYKNNNLTKEQQNQILKIKDQLEKDINLMKDTSENMYSSEEKGRKIKGYSLQAAGEIREIIQGDSLDLIDNGLTPTELQKKLDRENSNYNGKEVIVDGKKGKILSRAYGKYKIELEDGNVVTKTKEEFEAAKKIPRFVSEVNDYRTVNQEGETTEENEKRYYQTNRLQNENIPATKSDNVISEKIEKPKKEEQQVPNKITVKDLKQTSKNITKELNETFKLNKGEAYSKTPQTVVKAMAAYQTPPVISDFDRDTLVHKIITDAEAKEYAETKFKEIGSLEENASYVRGLLQSDKKLSKNDKALAVYTMKEAYNQGQKEIADGIVEDITVLDTESAQWMQASKLIKQMTPIGQLETFVKMVKRSIEKGNPRFKNVKITDEMINNVIEKSYDKNNTWNQDKFAKNMEEFKANIQSQLKPTLMDKFNTIRMIGMLGAPKTHIRNMLANVGNLGLRVSKNFNARVLETAFVRDQSKRTRTFKPSTQAVKNFAKQTTLEEKDAIAGNKYDEHKMELEKNMKVFNENHKGIAKVLNQISKLTNLYSGGNTYLLNAEDTLFSAPTYKRSLQEFLTARGIKTEKDIQDNPKIVNAAKEFALQQALESVYRQDSEMATAITNYVKKMERSDKKRHKFAGVIVESNLPFKRTPINIGKTGYEYSPIGLTSGIYDTMKSVTTGKVEISQAIDEVSKGITGLGLLGVGVLLAHNGWELKAGEDDKEKKADYDKGLGEKEYSIKVGNRYYDVSWMAPSAMPFYTGIELYQQLVKTQKFDGNAVVGTLAKTIDPLTSMSFMQGITRTLQSYADSPGEIISTFTLASLENYVSQYIPTILSQIADISDDKKRTTTVSGDSSFKELDKTWNNIKYKIPFARQTLEENTDSWGRTSENDKFGLRLFNDLVNPANNSKDKKDATDREIERLYYALGEDSDLSTKALPKQDFDKYLTYNKKEYKLSSKDWTEFKKTYGKIAKDGADKLIKTEKYKNATDEEKAKYLESLYDYSNQKAKEEYGIKHNLDYDSYKLDQIYALVDAFDIPIETIITNKSIGQLRAENGISGNKRKYQAVDGINGLTELQKDVLKRKFTMFMGHPAYKKTKSGENVSYELVDALYNSNTSYDDDKYIKKFLDLN